MISNNKQTELLCSSVFACFFRVLTKWETKMKNEETHNKRKETVLSNRYSEISNKLEKLQTFKKINLFS